MSRAASTRKQMNEWIQFILQGALITPNDMHVTLVTTDICIDVTKGQMEPDVL